MKISIFTSLLFHLSCLTLLTFHFDISNGYSSKHGFIPRECEALLNFKNHLIDPSNKLSSWNASNPNCCEWVGVVCSDITTNVLQLHLNSSPPIEDDYHFYENQEADEAYQSSWFGGEINNSLVELKHLTHLDLSNNDFGDMQIPAFVWEMTSLTYLNLSNAGFNGIISPRIGNLSNLLYLDLSYATNGTIPSQIGNLTNLLQLGFGGDYMHEALFAKSLHWLSSLSRIQYLKFENSNLSSSLDWLQTLQALPSLIELRLSACMFPTLYNQPSFLNFSSLLTLDLSHNKFSFIPKWVFDLKKLVSLELQDNNMQGLIPDGIYNLTLLENLDLSRNSFSSSIPDWLYTLRHLKFLNLNGNHLCGKISYAMGNLTSLVKLDLSYNYQLEGRIPLSFGNLCNLREIYFSDFKLNQEVNEILEILSHCVSHGLKKLKIKSCQLSGSLTNHIGLFKNLHTLDFYNNSIHGVLPRSFGKLSSITILCLSKNKLSGELPKSFGKLSSLSFLDLSENQFNGNPFEIAASLSELTYLDIHDNLFQGVVTQDDLSNFTSLKVFSASTNNLTLEVGQNWHPNFQLYELQMSLWKLGPHFPSWIQSQKGIKVLEMFNTGISDSIPPWFWEIFSRANFLNLSHNHIHGELSFTSTKSIFIHVVDLSSNLLSGKLPYYLFSDFLSWLDLSSNSFSGLMTDFLCKKQDDTIMLSFLNLGSNNLSGQIPDCWEMWPNLVSLNLENNHLTGNLPPSMGSLTSLQVLQIRNNSISGTFPTFLKKNNNLIFLDIGENRLTGTVPTWIGERLSNLKILSLRSNEFSSHIPKEICDIIFLQYLDLAENKFSGNIPNCFNNLTAMMLRNTSKSSIINSNLPLVTWTGPSTISATLWVKGTGMEYKSFLGLVTSVDLSNNNLSGEIPQEITNLNGLIYLNFSKNQLGGQIPQHIGNMKLLESIDFSWNQLSGEIPATMSKLSFLNKLDLSHNHLKGEIPIGTQLQTFEASSFIDNNLCGPPLPVNCSSHKKIPNDDNDKESDAHGVNWFFVTMALGFIMGFWGVVAPLFISRSWRHTYYRFLDDMWYKMQSCW